MNEIVITAILVIAFLTMWAAREYSQYELDRLQKRQLEHLETMAEVAYQLGRFFKVKP